MPLVSANLSRCIGSTRVGRTVVANSMDINMGRVYSTRPRLDDDDAGGAKYSTDPTDNFL